MDAAGHTYITGSVQSTDFPVTASAFQQTLVNPDFSSSAFITELNASGSGLVYSTLYGGSLNTSGNAIAVDASGNSRANKKGFSDRAI